MCAHLEEELGIRAQRTWGFPWASLNGVSEMGLTRTHAVACTAYSSAQADITQHTGSRQVSAPCSHRLRLLGQFLHPPHTHCALTSSLACLDQARLHTCEPVSMHCRGWPVRVFQNRMQRSAVPPPEASSPCWCGDQAIAFTAARCSVYCCTGLRLEWFHTSSCRAGQGKAMTEAHSGTKDARQAQPRGMHTPSGQL